MADRYRIERELGQGGMATVYLAHDLKHARVVALKVLRHELAATLNRERFAREVQVTARLQHAHILPVLESGETAGHLWYTMPYVEGESLRARMDREGQLAIDAALDIAREVSDALSYAHARDVVHRDIKPENILLAGGHAFVADFGIARALDEVGAERLTQTGLGLGTPHYMSPEQALGEREVDGRTDLYALACVLYEMLAGEPPYDGATAQSIIAKRLSQPAPSVRVLRETVPEAVDRALMKALAKAPADRFATTGEFVLALSAASPAPRLAARAPWRAITIGVAVVLAAGVGAAWTAARSSSAVIDPAASVIAVMPLIPASGDTALARLGRDLAGTISSSLDGIGDIRSIDRLTILAQVPAGAPLPLADASALARRLGASGVVHGTISRDGPRVRLDVNLFTTDSMAPIARGTVLADAENLGAMTDSVVWRLLADIWRKGSPPTPTLAAITTRSVDALRAYLDGERYLVAGDEQQARAAFGRAIAADSTFWFAYYRKGNAMGWAELQVDSATEATYMRHRDKLPARDRMMITASRHDSGLVRQRAQLEELVRHYPDYWPAWWILGDNLHHLYPQTIGSSKDDARQALERVVALNPSLVYAWQHLGQVYASQRDTAGLVRVLDNLARLNGRPIFIKGDQVDHVLLFETTLALLRGRPSASEVVDKLYDGTVKPGIELWLPSRFLSFNQYGSLQIAFDQRLLDRGLTPDGTVNVLGAMGDAWAMRGAWDSVFSVRDRLAPSRRDASWVLDGYRLAVIGAWAGAIPPAEAVRRRPEAYRLAAPQGPGTVTELAWLDGLLAVATDDATELAAARARITQAPSTLSQRLTAPQLARFRIRAAFLDRSLAAFDAAMRGDKRRAAATMTALESEMADSVPYYGVNLFLRGVNRLAAAEWIVTAGGDTAQALRLLSWHRATIGPTTDKVTLGPLAVLLEARIREARHDTTAAIAEYNVFLRRFDAPVPAMRHLVSEAHSALGRLAGPAAVEQREPPGPSTTLKKRPE